MKLTRVVVGAGCLLVGGYIVSPSLAQETDSEHLPQTPDHHAVRQASRTELLDASQLGVTSPGYGHSESLQDELLEFEQAQQTLLAAEDDIEGGEAPGDNNPDDETSGDEINEDLRVPLRAGIGYSSSGAGFDGFGQFEGFIPVWQQLGKDVVFLETRLLIDNGAHLGGNLLLGGRHYYTDRNQILGGYASFDTRSTGDSTFYQLGLGFERLARWDFRANAYVPLGETSNQVSDSGFVDTGSGISTGFVGRRLVLTNEIERTRITRDEVALVALDLEAGGAIARWEGGDIRGYAGTYAYLADRVPTTFGWKVRLDARPQPNLTLGVAVQGDELFGTNIVATVGATFPRLRPNRELSDREAIITRLREPVYRNNAITVDTVTETEQEFERQSDVLFNPEEEEPYLFTHVTLGASGGDGTFENPFGTVEEALQATLSDGNDIVYVDGEANIPIPAFEISDDVSVLSQGPEQTLAGLPFPGFPAGGVRLPFNPDVNFDNGIIVELPFSGDGAFPTITGGGNDLVTLGNNTVLAGFQLESAPQNAIAGENVNNIELRNNRIANAGATGIAFSNVTGSAILFDNSITGSGDRGIAIANNELGDLEAEISGFQLEDNLVGLEAISEGTGFQGVVVGPSSSENTSRGVAPGVSINNEIIGSGNQGLIVQAGNLGEQELSMSQSTISDSGAEGALITADDNATQLLTLSAITIRDNGGSGVRVNGETTALGTATTQELSIENNSEISGNQGDGITIEANGILGSRVIQGFSFTNSAIVDNAGAGIRSTALGSSQQEFNPTTGNVELGIGNNLISGNGEEGIIFVLGDGTPGVDTILFAEVEGNTFANNGGANGDLIVTAADTNASACVFVTGNTIPAGIEFNITAPPALFEIQDLPNFFNAGGNNSPTNGFAPVTLNPNAGEYTTPSGDGVCFQ